MMNGYVVKRGDCFVARITAKSSFYDARGDLWSRELQAARVFMSEQMACREAKRVGGVVREKRDGRLIDA